MDRNGRALHILVVDDDHDLCALLLEVLSDAGYAAACVHDGEAAWRAIVDHHPKLVLSDITMPHLDGIGLARRLIAADFPVPVILMSVGDGNEATTVSAAFLHKPFALDHLLAHVARVLDDNHP